MEAYKPLVETVPKKTGLEPKAKFFGYIGTATELLFKYFKNHLQNLN